MILLSQLENQILNSKLKRQGNNWYIFQVFLSRMYLKMMLQIGRRKCVYSNWLSPSETSTQHVPVLRKQDLIGTCCGATSSLTQKAWNQSLELNFLPWSSLSFHFAISWGQLSLWSIHMYKQSTPPEHPPLHVKHIILRFSFFTVLTNFTLLLEHIANLDLSLDTYSLNVQLALKAQFQMWGYCREQNKVPVFSLYSSGEYFI